MKVEALKTNVNRTVLGNSSVTSFHNNSLALKREGKKKKEIYTVTKLTSVSCKVVSRGEDQFCLMAGASRGQFGCLNAPQGGRD